jgi:hypothetical protein
MFYKINKLLFLLLLLSSVIACSDKDAKLVLSKNMIEMGDISERKIYTYTVELKNDGSNDLDIEDIRTSCVCIYANSSKMRLHGGDTATLNVEINSDNFNDGPIDQEIRIYLRNSENPESIKISGKMKLK